MGTQNGLHTMPNREARMSKVTRATKMLEQAGIAFTAHSYDYDPAASRIGLQAAEAGRGARALAQDPHGSH